MKKFLVLKISLSDEEVRNIIFVFLLVYTVVMGLILRIFILVFILVLFDLGLVLNDLLLAALDFKTFIDCWKFLRN